MLASERPNATSTVLEIDGYKGVEVTILVIDDEREFADCREVIYCRTAHEEMKLLNANTPLEQLWLDHDLGEPDECGYTDVSPIVNFLFERAVWDNPYPVSKILVHTANVPAAKRLLGLGRYYPTIRVDAVSSGLIKP